MPAGRRCKLLRHPRGSRHPLSGRPVPQANMPRNFTVPAPGGASNQRLPLSAVRKHHSTGKLQAAARPLWPGPLAFTPQVNQAQITSNSVLHTVSVLMTVTGESLN